MGIFDAQMKQIKVFSVPKKKKVEKEVDVVEEKAPEDFEVVDEVDIVPEQLTDEEVFEEPVESGSWYIEEKE